MPETYLNYDEIKRKIRKLKQLEFKIRFGNIENTYLSYSANLVWNEFFDFKDNKKVKYSLEILAAMNKEEFKNVISEFFYNVYFRFYKENGIVNALLYDPDILVQIGLPLNASEDDIKKRFRELAKKYHPDTGGDSAMFIELIEKYRKLIN